MDNHSNFSVDSVVDDPINYAACPSTNPPTTCTDNVNEIYKNKQDNRNISKSEPTREADDILSAQGKPMENQQMSGVISYNEPNPVPPSHRVHHTDLKCLPIDNGSKQTTDKKEIEGSTSPCDTGQDKIEISRAFNRIITTSDEDHNHRQNADPFGPPANSLSPHIPSQAPEKGASNSLTKESAKYIRR
jgi:hypothetical protein